MPSMTSPIRVTYEEELKISTHIIFHGREQGIFHPLTLPTHLILTTELFSKALLSKQFIKKRKDFAVLHESSKVLRTALPEWFVMDP